MFLPKSMCLKALSKNIAKAFCENANLVEKIITTGKGWPHLSHCALLFAWDLTFMMLLVIYLITNIYLSQQVLGRERTQCPGNLKSG